MKKVFISYSHEDQGLKKQFVKHLSGLIRIGDIKVWDDKEVLFGKRWDEEIRTNLCESDIVIFLISSDFLASEYINEVEIKETLQRHENKEVYLAPIFLRPCDFESSLLSSFQCVPRDAKFITTDWNDIDTAFYDVVKELKKIIQEFEKIDITEKKVKIDNEIQLVDTNSKDSLIGETEGVSIEKVMEVLSQEANDLNYNTTKEDISKIQSLRIKIQEEYFKEIENQLEFVLSNKELMHSTVLFDTIYASEILNSITVTEIQNIREDFNKKYNWYDRSIIACALSLSLINFKFDQKKANLLLDFVIDFEPKVWERALTGLIIAIVSQKKKSWLRAENFIRRLKTLQNSSEIQEGLKTIDFILKNELYKACLFSPNLFKLELFKNPMNCFVPFYENNNVLKTALDNAESDFDTDEFQRYLNEMPFMDSYKYALCIGLTEGGLKTKKLKGEKAMRITNSLMISDNLSPFQNLISEYYCFFNYFPEKRIDDLFEKQYLLTKTDLKTIVLNKTMQLLLDANTKLNEGQYPEAIVKYQDLLKIDKNHKEARWQLANCYGNKNEIKKALAIFLELEKDGENSNRLLQRIAKCYNGLYKYSESNKYCEKIENKGKTPNFDTLLLMAENYQELENNIKSELYCKKAEEKISNEDEMYNLSIPYLNIEKYDDALRLIKKALETEQNIAKYWAILGCIYIDLFSWDLSILNLEKALKFDQKDLIALFNLGRSLLLSKRDLKKAKTIFEKILKSKNQLHDVAYGNLGHLYLIEENRDMALEEYTKCIMSIKDERKFKRKMQIDLKFISNLGISESQYNSIIIEVIEHYKITKNKSIVRK